MTSSGVSTPQQFEQRILDIVKQYWGFDTFRPLQAEAIRAGLDQRDSLVVMPTGGGKSLCYQVPPVVADRIDIVISPLISLMKDQVDGLRSNGYPAAALHSGLTPEERTEVHDGIKHERYRLLFLSPERLITSGFMEVISHMNVQAFAIDEAHCISHWGHDFRPEYRQLATLKQRFPGASVHAFTATATPRVQRDIVEQLHLVDPNILVGIFDRPNLTYRILPRVDLHAQIIEIIRRHPREAVIVYCLTRKDTETVSSVLKANGIDAAHYHAGLTSEVRRKTQEAFSEERLDVVVATVAFGMGIDRSDVRCVIHAAMPKSIEHYQQETGRAGRDGLEAECVLLYSAADVMRWQRLIELSAAESGNPEESLAPQRELLKHINGLCTTLECRHQALTRYFGQEYQPPEPPEVMQSGKALDSELPGGSGGCRACDVCLDEVESMPDATMITRKIISCVARLKQGFGVGYLVQVLRGASTQQVRDWKHDDLSTYGLLREIPEKVLTNLVYQLVDQNLLARSGGDRPVVMLNEQSIAVMKGEREVKLIEPRTGPVQKTQPVVESWEGVDKGLFEHLRELRRAIAQERAVPAYVVFGDKTLRSMATIRPASIDSMMIVHGVGEKKLADLGQQFVEAIVDFCVEHDLSTDERDGAGPAGIVRPKPQKKTNPQRGMAFGMFARGASIRDVMEATGRAEVTVEGYLEQFIEERKPGDIAAWVDEATYPKVTAAIDEVGMEALRPIYLKLNEQVSYGEIRAVAAHLRVRREQE